MLKKYRLLVKSEKELKKTPEILKKHTPPSTVFESKHYTPPPLFLYNHHQQPSLRVTAVQYVDMCLSTTSTTHEYKVDCIEEENIDAKTGVYSDTFKICPLLAKCKESEGFAVDGKLKTEETNLAGSFNQEIGITVNYKIKVKVSVGGGIMGGTMVAEVPFELCHFGKVGAGRVKQLQQSK